MDQDSAYQRLQDELEEAKSVIHMKQEQLELSARFGKQLLVDNSELSAKLESTIQVQLFICTLATRVSYMCAFIDVWK